MDNHPFGQCCYFLLLTWLVDQNDEASHLRQGLWPLPQGTSSNSEGGGASERNLCVRSHYATFRANLYIRSHYYITNQNMIMYQSNVWCHQPIITRSPDEQSDDRGEQIQIQIQTQIQIKMKIQIQIQKQLSSFNQVT